MELKNVSASVAIDAAMEEAHHESALMNGRMFGRSRC